MPRAKFTEENKAALAQDRKNITKLERLALEARYHLDEIIDNWRGSSPIGKDLVKKHEEWRQAMFKQRNAGDIHGTYELVEKIISASHRATELQVLDFCRAFGQPITFVSYANDLGGYKAHRQVTVERLEELCKEASEEADKLKSEMLALPAKIAEANALAEKLQAEEPSREPVDDGTDAWEAIVAAREELAQAKEAVEEAKKELETKRARFLGKGE